MDVIYCKKCHERKRVKKYEAACDEIQQITGAKNIDDYCVSYCGPGAKEHFAVIDDEIIEANSYDDLIKELKKYNDN